MINLQRSQDLEFLSARESGSQVANSKRRGFSEACTNIEMGEGKRNTTFTTHEIIQALSKVSSSSLLSLRLSLLSPPSQAMVLKLLLLLLLPSLCLFLSALPCLMHHLSTSFLALYASSSPSGRPDGMPICPRIPWSLMGVSAEVSAALSSLVRPAGSSEAKPEA